LQCDVLLYPQHVLKFGPPAAAPCPIVQEETITSLLPLLIEHESNVAEICVRHVLQLCKVPAVQIAHHHAPGINCDKEPDRFGALSSLQMYVDR